MSIGGHQRPQRQRWFLRFGCFVKRLGCFSESSSIFRALPKAHGLTFFLRTPTRSQPPWHLGRDRLHAAAHRDRLGIRLVGHATSDPGTKPGVSGTISAFLNKEHASEAAARQGLTRMSLKRPRVWTPEPAPSAVCGLSPGLAWTRRHSEIWVFSPPSLGEPGIYQIWSSLIMVSVLI